MFAAARQTWRKTQGSISIDRLVFIDETWATTNMTRRYGRAPSRTAPRRCGPARSLENHHLHPAQQCRAVRRHVAGDARQHADGIDVSDWIASWDDSTNPAKGAFILRKEASGAVLGIFAITSVADNTTWLQLNVTYVSGSGALSAADPVYLTPFRSGDKGADGSVAAPVRRSTARWRCSAVGRGDAKRAAGSGLVKLTSGVLGTASAGTDYAPGDSGAAILKGNGAGGFSAAVPAPTPYNPGGTDVALADGGTGATPRRRRSPI